MQKEKSVKSYTRRTKSGKTVVVHAYKAKYDAAEEIRKALAKKEGAGKELANRKKQVEQPIPDNKLGFSAEEFKAWYHWDMVDDPKNKAALKVEKALKKSMGVKAYNKFLDDMTDGYSARGHNKAFKGLESSLSSQKKETSKGQKGEPSKKTGNTDKPTSAKETKVQKIGKVTFGKGSNLRLETWDDDPKMKGAATVYYKGGTIDEAGYKKIEAEMAKRGYKPSDFPFHEGDGTGFFSFQKKDVPTKTFRPPKNGKASAPKSVKSIESKLDEMAHLTGNDAKQAVKLLKEAGYRRKKVTYTANDGNREDWALISPDGHRVYMTREGNTMLMKFPGITSAKHIPKKPTKGKTSTNHVIDEDGRKHSTKRNSLGISPAEWAVYNSGGVGIKGMSDKEVKAAIKHVESTLKKNLGSKVKSFKEYLDDSAQGGGDFKADMKKLQGIISAKGSETYRAQNTPTDRPLTYGQAFKRAKDNFKKRRAAAKYEKPTNIKTLQSKGWQLHGRELPSLRSKKTQEAFLVSPDGKKMYRLSAAINPIGRGMIPMWRLNKNAELLDTTTAIRRKFEK